MATRLGYIFECGRDGADYQVCKHFLGRLNPKVEMVPVFLDRKPTLIENCGPAAALLLKTCRHVVIQWDLFPFWSKLGTRPCRHDDCQAICSSLAANRVPLSRVSFLCVQEELEAWLLADRRAIAEVISRLKHPHPIGRIPEFGNSETVTKPKTCLTRIFNQELGQHKRYKDLIHAIQIAKAVPDFVKLRRVPSFKRFAVKAAGVSL